MMRGPPLRDWSLVSLADEYAALHVRRTRATSTELVKLPGNTYDMVSGESFSDKSEAIRHARLDIERES
jgi:hypothetical protein